MGAICCGGSTGDDGQARAAVVSAPAAESEPKSKAPESAETTAGEAEAEADGKPTVVHHVTVVKSDEFCMGVIVEAHSLSDASEVHLEGAAGKISGVEGDRIKVQFDETLGERALKRENLRVATEFEVCDLVQAVTIEELKGIRGRVIKITSADFKVDFDDHGVKTLKRTEIKHADFKDGDLVVPNSLTSAVNGLTGCVQDVQKYTLDVVFGDHGIQQVQIKFTKHMKRFKCGDTVEAISPSVEALNGILGQVESVTKDKACVKYDDHGVHELDPNKLKLVQAVSS